MRTRFALSSAVLAISLVAIFGGFGCGNSAATDAKLPSASDAFGGQQCTAYRPPTEPDLMAWDSGSRANLNFLHSQGAVAVRYKATGCNVELEVLSNCIGKGSYQYTPYSASETKTARNARELFAELPIHSANVRAKMGEGRALRTDYMLSGIKALPIGAVYRRAELEGTDCSKATHIVSKLYIGGFAMVAGATNQVEAAAGVFGVGAGVSSSNSVERVSTEGLAEACQNSQRTGTVEKQCSVPLRIGLVRLADVPEDEPKPSSPTPTSPSTKPTAAPTATAKTPSRFDVRQYLIVDSVTKLEWQKSASSPMSFRAAYDYCDSLGSDGRSSENSAPTHRFLAQAAPRNGWRIPSVEELTELYAVGSNAGFSDFRDTFWSANPAWSQNDQFELLPPAPHDRFLFGQEAPRSYTVVNMATGRTSKASISQSYKVRCVREPSP